MQSTIFAKKVCASAHSPRASGIAQQLHFKSSFINSYPQNCASCGASFLFNREGLSYISVTRAFLLNHNHPFNIWGALHIACGLFIFRTFSFYIIIIFLSEKQGLALQKNQLYQKFDELILIYIFHSSSHSSSLTWQLGRIMLCIYQFMFDCMRVRV